MKSKSEGLTQESKFVIDQMSEIRKSKKMTLRDLSVKMGVSPSTLQKLEAKTVKYLDMNYVFKFSREMGVKVTSLLPGARDVVDLRKDDDFVSAAKDLSQSFGDDFEKLSALHAIIDDIEVYCKNAISSFYGALKINDPDVFVERCSKSTIRIRFGFRPAYPNKALAGPFVVVLATPEGNLLWIPDLEWIDRDDGRPVLEGEKVSVDSWRDELRERLVSFLTEGEKKYRDAAHR